MDRASPTASKDINHFDFDETLEGMPATVWTDGSLLPPPGATTRRYCLDEPRFRHGIEVSAGG